MTVHVRDAKVSDLEAVLALYRQLSPEDPVLPADAAEAAWLAILACPVTHVLLAETENAVVSTCTITIVPNMTRSARPYALVENVVTRADRRRQGHGTAVLRAALDRAWAANAYKVMLATGSTRESTHRFYETAGFAKGAKTFFQARGGAERGPPLAG